MQIKNIAALLCMGTFTLLSLLSCEGLIEVEKPVNQIYKKEVFENTKTATAALAGLYASLFESSPLAGDQTGSLMGVYTDDMTFNVSVSNSGLPEIYGNQQIAANPKVLSYWTSAYQLVYTANAIIEGTEASTTLADKDKNWIKGEALLLRSILYFYLQQVYGDIPFVTQTDYTINRQMAKTSSDQLLDKLAADLETAGALLSDDYRSAERIFPNRKVAEIMLAKVLALQHKYAEAEVLFQDIIKSPLYQLEKDLSKTFLKDGKHILWQLKPKLPGNITKEALQYIFSNALSANYTVSPDLISVFSTNDKRRKNWIVEVPINSEAWYGVYKYKNRVDNNTEYSIVFRLDEVYLLLAEVLAQQGKIGEALPYINAIRQKAAISLLEEPIDQNSLLEEILLENRREFFAEMGLRFLTLKRFNRLDDLKGVKPNWKSYHANWPLPEKELLLNPKLNPQSTGY
ncbi:RagB/SusD family nutrient uptake outer membrane protein [Sphingobacterium tabacisoli]|uniref:RagB/SusD family nutrient uptake outer membrane protein n=1 Tax=Sphingobacterium tabacisoli TaxID=2044855 RepID=A0ABW5L3B7_9SPHI|nr:RagB/SusD family nutrient uptake outer membrane protein [Sphingobacterium tabacisoli]